MAVQQIILTGWLVLGVSGYAPVAVAHAFCNTGEAITPDEKCLRKEVRTPQLNIIIAQITPEGCKTNAMLSCYGNYTNCHQLYQNLLCPAGPNHESCCVQYYRQCLSQMPAAIATCVAAIPKP
jgi:hypothetical protein